MSCIPPMQYQATIIPASVMVSNGLVCLSRPEITVFVAALIINNTVSGNMDSLIVVIFFFVWQKCGRLADADSYPIIGHVVNK